MKIILEKISDVIDLSSLSQEERDRYVLERANRGIALAQAGAIPSDVVTFMLANYIKLNWRGAWSSDRSYKYNDAVSYLGSSYVALRATSEQPGESAADWDLIAKKGEDGLDGRGIVSFDLFDVQEKTKIYRLLYTDATYVDIPIIDGNDGVDGLTPYIGMNGNWWIGDVDQNIKAEGVDGISPTIGLNGNWWIGDVDTGIKAAGTSTYEIYIAGGGTLSEVDFNASITNVPAHIEDATKHIDTTTAEFSGTIDETNDKLTIWDNSLLKWIRFSFTSLKTFIGTYFLRLDQTTPQTLTNSPKITDLLVGQMCYVDANKQLKPIDVFWDNVNKRMGINRPSPTRELDIVGIIRNTGFIATADGKTLLTGGALTYDTNSAIKIGNINTGSLSAVAFVTKNIEAVRIDTNQNVGIKTATPKSALQVAGGIQCGDDTAAASADKVGTFRSRPISATEVALEFCRPKADGTGYEWARIQFV